MNNEELKKKILTIVRGAMIEADELPFIETTDNIADALIAAGIGDVKEVKFEGDHYWSMWQGALVELERAERRAEVAERALREFAVQVGCRSCPYKGRCDISNPSAKNDYQECYEVALRIAEKELAEEKR